MKRQNIIEIPVPKDFNFSECLWFLNRNYDDCLHSIKEGEIIKAIEMDRQLYLLRITKKGEKLIVEILQGNTAKEDKRKLAAYVNDWFDMERKLDDFYALLLNNKRVAYMREQFNGLRLVGIPDLFEALCWSIIGQQINLNFAYTLKRRLVERYGRSIGYGNGMHYVFPSPKVLAQVTVAELRQMQFSGRKAEYVIGVASEFAEGRLSRLLLEGLSTIEEKQSRLTSIKGIGIWTANYVLMKCLREPGSIPYGDIGLLNALESHGIIKDRNEAAKIHRFFKKYKGWESYMVFYLWRSLSIKGEPGKS